MRSVTVAMSPFMAAHAIGDFGTAAGVIDVPQALAERCAEAVLADGIDAAVSYRMQVDHGFAQPLEELLGGLRRYPVIPIFINSVAPPLPGFQRARLLGEAVGRFARSTGKRVLLLGSGGQSCAPAPEVSGVISNRGQHRHFVMIIAHQSLGYLLCQQLAAPF